MNAEDTPNPLKKREPTGPVHPNVSPTGEYPVLRPLPDRRVITRRREADEDLDGDANSSLTGRNIMLALLVVALLTAVGFLIRAYSR